MVWRWRSSGTIVVFLGVLAGGLLAIAGVLFPIAVMPPGATTADQAQYLLQRQSANYAYVAAVLLSNLLVTPVFLLLSIRLYPRRPNVALVAGSFVGFAIVLESVAVLASLARWAWAIPAAAAGDPVGASLFETLQVLFLALDLPGASLFYVAAVVYAVASGAFIVPRPGF